MNYRKAGILFFLTICLEILTSVLLNIAGSYIPALYDIIPSTLLSEAVVLLPSIAFACMTEEKFGEMFPWKRIRVESGVLSVLMMILIFPLVMVANLFTMLFVQNTVEAMRPMISRYPMWIMILLIGVLAPVCEELVFRGYIFRSLYKSTGFWPAALISAIMFGMMHLNFNQAAYAFVIGMFFAGLAWASGSLWSSVIAHAVFNSVEVVIMYAAGSLLEPGTADEAEGLLADPGQVASLGIFLLLAAGIVVLFGLLAVRCIRRIRILEEKADAGRFEEENCKSRWSISIFAVSGMIISVIFMILSASML